LFRLFLDSIFTVVNNYTILIQSK